MFGTDGIRGKIDIDITSQLTFKLGKAIARFIYAHGLEKKVIIGKDTRTSGDMLMYSVASSLLDCGIDVYVLNIVPTACVSFLVTKMKVGVGIMITASHNTKERNGIKIINNLGYKLSLDEEREVQKLYQKKDKFYSEKKGRIIFDDSLVESYKNYIINEIDIDLTNFSIALDAGNGSNYKIAPEVFKRLGANIVPICCENDGEKINENCGAEHIELLKQEVLFHKCDFGFAFDGDADRLRVVLSNGKVLDGDDIIYIIACYLKDRNKLNSLSVVGTVMTNTGVEKSLNDKKINLIRVDVGDRFVVECIRKNNYCLGGETSGHICLHEYNTTCDALFNAVFFMKICLQKNCELDDYLIYLNKIPQTLTNIGVDTFTKQRFLHDETIYSDVDKVQLKYLNEAKILIRPSGTEDKIRIMVESGSVELNKLITKEIRDIIGI